MTDPDVRKARLALDVQLRRRRRSRPVCEVCERPLSIYNPDRRCGPCAFKLR